MTALTRLERARTLAGQRLGLPWSRLQPNPKPELLSSFRLFGIVTTWMEAGVIAATVANALAQGCERVYLLDNDSPGDTIEQALAGARLGVSFSSTTWREEARIEIVNRLISDISAATDDTHVWWLVTDADEFYNGPVGSSIGHYLDRLDRRFRTVGASALHHLQSSRPANLVGFHRLGFQPLCTDSRWAACPVSHWKHPLLRWTIDAAYAGRWDEVAIESRAPIGVRARPWQSLVAPADQPAARWYRPNELAAATAAWRAQHCPA